MNIQLILLTLCQGLFLTNNVTFIAINGLVGLRLAPQGWMATLPVMGYVVGAALSTGLVAHSQSRWGRKVSFQIGLGVALFSTLLAAYAAWRGHFGLLVLATVIAGYYSANGQLYRFAAAELVPAGSREKAVSLVLAGGLIGAIGGPYLASHTRTLYATPFLGAYLALGGVALLSMLCMAFINFPAPARAQRGESAGRPLLQIVRQPVFIVAAVAAAMGYGVMNLLMAATPLAMQVCGFSFEESALVLQWHVIGMFAPGFFTGHLIKRFGTLRIMALGVALNAVCIAIALTGVALSQFLIALFVLGLGWNFLFTGSTTLALQAWSAAEKDRAQAALNFCVFATMAVTSFASGALVTTQGWNWLNRLSALPLLLTALALAWMAMAAQKRSSAAA
jgi:MFS family permease